jgi:NADPH-dependent F420 reductase
MLSQGKHDLPIANSQAAAGERGKESGSMNVAIIGTGNVGSALGSSLSRAGHSVTFYSRDEQKKADAADAASAGTASSASDAAKDADVIVLAVPYAAAAGVAREIASVAEGKVVIDTTNPLNASYSGLETKSGDSATEEIAAELTDAHVAKAFNTVFANVQADPAAKSETLDVLFAADDAEARSAVAELATSIGFRPVWVGPLAAARELEALAMLNIRLQMITNGNWNTAFKLVDAPDKALAA